MIPYLLVTLDDILKIKKHHIIKLLVSNFFFYSLTYITINIYYFNNIINKLYELINFYIINFFFIIIFIFLSLKNLYILKKKESNLKKDKNYEDICIIIPTYSPTNNIEITLVNLLKIFNKDNIYIIENGKNQEKKIKNMLIKKYKVNYFYLNKKSKMCAINHGLSLIKDKFKYCLLLDDDTIINNNFYIDLNIFNNYSGVGFSINTNNNNLFNKLITLEYLIYFYNKSFQKECEYLNGCCSMWKVDDIYNIFKNSPNIDLLDSGEDSINGILVNFCNLKLKHSFDNFFTTSIPDNIIFNSISKNSGYNSKSFYQQRNFRWYRNGFIKMIIKIFLSKKHIIFYKIFFLLFICFFYSILFNFLKIFKFYILSFLIYFILYLILISFMYYIKFKNTEQHFNFYIIIFYPFYFLMTTLLKVLSVIGCITYYLPLNLNKKLINRFYEIKKQNQEQEKIEIKINKKEDEKSIERYEIEMDEVQEIKLELEYP